MTQLGVIGIDEVNIVELSQISESDIIRSDLETKEQLLAHLGSPLHQIFRIKVHFIGVDPRLELRNNADLNTAEINDINKKLDKMDRSNKDGHWTARVLEIINENPATLSGELAQILGLDKAKFKSMVRRLKGLGLTESLDVGYKLSPRGQAFVRSLNK